MFYAVFQGIMATSSHQEPQYAIQVMDEMGNRLDRCFWLICSQHGVRSLSFQTPSFYFEQTADNAEWDI